MTRAIWTLRVLLACAIGLLVIVGACVRHLVARPRQSDAEAIVWRETYHETNPVPAVTWVTAGLSCAGGTGWLSATQGCISGSFSEPDWAVAVAWPLGETSFAPTAYAHELLHAHLYVTTGDEDNRHKRVEWSTLLIAANAELTKAGL